MFNLITRAEWGARPPRSRFSIPTPTRDHWLHHAAGAVLPGDDTVSSADLRRIRSIQNYHMDKRGWSDIAYSFLMDTDGNLFEGRGFGIAGGHTKGHNTTSHALCIMGNYDVQAVDADLIPNIVEYARFAFDTKKVPRLFTGGHRDASGAATSCPGKNLYAKLPEINELLKGDDMALSPAEEDFVRNLKRQFDDAGDPGYAAEFKEARAAGIFSAQTRPGDAIFASKLAVFLKRADALPANGGNVSGIQRGDSVKLV